MRKRKSGERKRKKNEERKNKEKKTGEKKEERRTTKVKERERRQHRTALPHLQILSTLNVIPIVPPLMTRPFHHENLREQSEEPPSAAACCPTRLPPFVTAFNIVNSHSGNQTGSLFFCLVGSPSPSRPRMPLGCGPQPKATVVEKSLMYQGRGERWG